MKTRTPAATGTPGLPPPPAPVSRDANPWPMATKPEAVKPRLAIPEAAPRERAEPGAVRRRHSRAGAEGAAARREPRLRWLPAMILVAVAGTALRVGVEALEAGDVESAVGALVMGAMVAFVAWRQFAGKR
jgi:hypothetical protein